jgi:hypothetical protein
MVLVKIEPQPVILRSCDMAHYPAPPTRLDSTRRSEWTAFPAKPKCCMCLNRGEGKIQPYLSSPSRRSRCLPLFHHRLSVFLFLSFLESTNIAET